MSLGGIANDHHQYKWLGATLAITLALLQAYSLKILPGSCPIDLPVLYAVLIPSPIRGCSDHAITYVPWGRFFQAQRPL